MPEPRYPAPIYQAAPPLMDYQIEGDDFAMRAWEDEESSEEEDQENYAPQYYQQNFEEVRPFPPQQQQMNDFQVPLPLPLPIRNPRTPKAAKAEAAPPAPGVFMFGKTQSSDAYLTKTWDLWSEDDIRNDREKLR